MPAAFDFSWVSQPSAWVSFLTLAALEIVLGIDNIIFISILSGKLPPEQRAKARNVGLGLAMVMRILMLLSIAWIMKLESELFHIGFLDSWITPSAGGGHGGGHGAPAVVKSTPGGITGRDLILIIGGLFLLGKSVHEIHHKLEGEHGSKEVKGVAVSFNAIIVQILMLDIVFSIDSVITAVGMVPPEQVNIMICAVIVAVGVMLFAAAPISSFVEKHPTIKMLALSFLLLIGMTLVAEGFQVHIQKGFIYFAMGFSVLVELLNIKMRGKHAPEPVHLREPYKHDSPVANAPAAPAPKDNH